MANSDPLIRALERALSGLEAHVSTAGALEGLPWKLAGEKPTGAPHTIFQILAHLVYWQGRCVQALRGESPTWPEHAEEGWPGPAAPGDETAWAELVGRFTTGLDEATELTRIPDLLVAKGKWAPVETLRSLASHNSYHLGQIVFLRQVLGSWPPPGGGDTW